MFLMSLVDDMKCSSCRHVRILTILFLLTAISGAVAFGVSHQFTVADLPSYSDSGIVTLNREGDIMEYTLDFEEMLGYESNWLDGKSLALLMPEKYRDAHRQGLRDAANDPTWGKHSGKIKPHRPVTCELTRADGTAVSVSVVVRRTNQDRFTGFIRKR